MNISYPFLILSIVLFSMSSNSWACTCAPISPISKRVEQASAVFSGEVIEIGEPLLDRLGLSKGNMKQVTFQVSERWKGARGKTLTEMSTLYTESCGLGFKVGKRYLVFVMPERPAGTQIGICSGTIELELASEELRELAGLKSKAPSSS